MKVGDLVMFKTPLRIRHKTDFLGIVTKIDEEFFTGGAFKKYDDLIVVTWVDYDNVFNTSHPSDDLRVV